jgi:4'-phosphopantetheinyl transferase EntD
MEARSLSSDAAAAPLSGGALAAILPASVSVAATRTDIHDAVLLPEESDAVRQAVERRRREFATGRACARAALEPWGLAGKAIPAGSGGEPLWPEGIVGSITHCDGYRACAAARAADLLTLGIDAEPNEPLAAGLLADVAFGDEPAAVRDLLGDLPGVRWDRLLFSAKEAAYKAWYPLARRWLGFEDATVTIDPDAGAFSVNLLAAGLKLPNQRLEQMAGRWAVEDGIILTAIAVP